MDVEIIGLLGVIFLAVLGGAFFFLKRGSDDEKRINAVDQERPRGPAASNLKANTAKTAQLSALRERLADNQQGASKRPAVSKPIGPAPSKPVAAPAGAIPTAAAPVAAPSWSPEEAGVVAKKSAAPSFHVAPETESARATREAEERAELGKVNIVLPLMPGAEAKPAPIVGAKPHILLVDDSKVVRVKTEKLLTGAGYQVTSAVDGIDALAKLDAIRPDVIITDIEMPNLDGFGLVRNVKNNLRTSEIPIIVMTSHVNLHLDIAATEGINGFLPKPFNDQDLLDQVSFLVES